VRVPPLIRRRFTNRRSVAFLFPSVEPGDAIWIDTMSTSEDTTRVWLVERTYSDDEQNMIILTYATTDGEQYFRKERALTSFDDVRDTTAAVDANPDNLGPVDEPEQREQYAAEAQRMANTHEPDDIV
jgi:3-deoxy-D-manno-octulosonic-acid transferase